MARPHPLLIDLAANREPSQFNLREADEMISSAIEHRVAGLLWSRIVDGTLEFEREETRRLAKLDLAVQAHHRRLWNLLEEVGKALDEIGVEVAVAKGVAAETRWYDRAGERPCRDIDLVLAPASVQSVDKVIARLDPKLPLSVDMSDLMRRGVLQSIDLEVHGIPVDLHADVLKVEIPIRGAEVLWARTQEYEAPSGFRYRALDPELSLVHFLIHLTKDRFSRLLGYADVSRILARESLDWDFIDDWVGREGLRVPVYSALYRVTDSLALPRPPVERPVGRRARAWSRFWPERGQLLGRLGDETKEHRRFWIPWLAEGRTREAMHWWLRRRVFPPAALVTAYYPDARGPYLVRLVSGRIRRALERRRAANRVR
jgi:hypothetical protein